MTIFFSYKWKYYLLPHFRKSGRDDRRPPQSFAPFPGKKDNKNRRETNLKEQKLGEISRSGEKLETGEASTSS